jgi:hypothetical protein
VLIKENVKNDRPDTVFPYSEEKNRSRPYVFLPDFVTTVSSPARIKTSPAARKQ